MSNNHTEEVPSEFEIIDDNNSSPSDELYLLVDFVVIKPQQPTERVTMTKFRVLRSLLTSEESLMTLIPNMLSDACIPSKFKQESIKVISQGVRALPSDKHHMFAYFVIIEFREQGKRWCVHLLRHKEMSLHVATSEAYALLTSDEGPLRRVCVICLEDFLIQTNYTRLPCSHVYHRHCIVQWSKKSNLCPLCRSQFLPSSLDSSPQN